MLLEMDAVWKEYGRGEAAVQALRGVTLGLSAGEFVVVMGPSGSGKSTLLQLAGGLDRPTAGQVRFQGQSLDGLGDAALSAFRLRHIGFVFQSFHLLPTLTAAENVALPLLLAGEPAGKAMSRALELLSLVGLENRAGHRPAQLSGGQMQRVAVARALVASPSILLADEPTGNLDTATGFEVLALLQRCQRELGRTVMMVTHDPRALRFGTRLVELRDGQITRDEGVNLSDVAVGSLD